MKRMLMWFVVGMVFSYAVLAHHVVDFYGVDAKEGAPLLQKYRQRIIGLQDAVLAASDNPHTTPAQWAHLSEVEKDLKRDIMKEGAFAAVGFDTIRYQPPSPIYTTLEIIKKNQPTRSHYLEHPKTNEVAIATPTKDTLVDQDVIAAMQVYTQKAVTLFLAGQLPKQGDRCPVYHCAFAFQHPQLKPYLEVFNTAAIQKKNVILAALRDDPDSERRAAAVFLIGHFRDPHEIVRVLLPYINDTSVAVRNNTIRVLSETVRRANIMTVDVHPFLALLDSPYGTDRNKSLDMLLALSVSKSARRVLLEEGRTPLLAMLALKQPNNHDVAYLILKQISGKTFAENDSKAWEHWFTTYQEKQALRRFGFEAWLQSLHKVAA